jgi:sulfoxide reductase catalytic subunit YedY
MLIKRPSDIPSSEITDETLYRNRREFIKKMSAVVGVSALGGILPACASTVEPAPQAAKKFGKYDTTEAMTPERSVISYNNYYEFGTQKEEPARNAGRLKISPWSVSVEGMVKKPATYSLDDLFKGITVEDRIYRMRCVEAWSMVIPWHGYPLAEVIKKLEPTSQAKYIVFQTLNDPNQMPYERYRDILNWPYTEGLRLDEAMNELTLLAVGVYGKVGPNQNGAPIRLVTPWKYGFKGVKAITKIKFTDKQPLTAWMEAAPREYGFYANVNPDVPHPRWSQAAERRLGTGLLGSFTEKKTLKFNGYGDQVASLYTGLDLKANF